MNVWERGSQQSLGMHLPHGIYREVAWERFAFMKEATAAQKAPYEIVLGKIHKNLLPLSQVTYALHSFLLQKNYRL